MKGVEHKATELLVTDAERTTKLHELLGSRFSNHGQLFLPTFPVYESLNTDEGLQQLAKDFCRWLGYKPSQLTVAYRPVTNGRNAVVDAASIIVNSEFRDHPLVTAGILSLAVLQFVIEHHHYIPDDRFIEVASIESGLGLWVINAFQPKRTKREKLYHMLDGNWLQLEGLQLNAISQGEYLRSFTLYTSANRHFPEEYGRSISKRTLHLLPSTPSTAQIIPLSEPSSTRAHIKGANGLWMRIIVLSLIVAALAIFTLLFVSQRSRPINFDETRDAQALLTIKTSWDNCIKQAATQQNTYDPNDLFMTRQIDATKTRCESLRNQYNEAVSHYQTNYPIK